MTVKRQPPLRRSTAMRPRCASTSPFAIARSSPLLLLRPTGCEVDRVNADGTLTKLGVITGLPPGLEGIASS